MDDLLALGRARATLVILGVARFVFTNDDASNEEAERLFSYGTLQTAPVQLAIFGRTFERTPDTLLGFRVIMSATGDQDFIKKTGAVHHRNLQFTGSESDLAEGTV